MSTDRDTRLIDLEISGDPFSMGVEIGRFGARVVNEYLTKTQAWATVIAHRNDPRVLRMAQQVQERFANYHMELSGLAEGLGLPFDEVFAWNCRGDIWAMAPDGCTTLQVPGPCNVIAHNEDGDPGFRGHCGLLRAKPTYGTGFTAFIYPGSLPGHTFAVTQAGLVQTVNNIRALDVGDGLPRMVLTRAVLDCQSLDEVVPLLRTAQRAGAFHLTLGQVGDPRMLSVEFTGQDCSVREIGGLSLHANHLIHDQMTPVRQAVTESSASRQKRGRSLIQDYKSGDDPREILHDTGGPGLPIYRDDPDDPDHENTLATAIFTIDEAQVDCDVYDRAGTPACYSFHEGQASAA